ncbi:MAG: Fe-S protein [Candidatus Gallionella acididurans]|uniref:Fe-S protein n=1 Tax=Candidatus Gallionella acididurans TaxID=1796491 RepID=A0A139BW14_9PROT|nr:MAG: Fe-S protein [Candidatus Gallionella acididurans]
MNPAKASARDVSAQISRLFVHPVKSCAGVEVREALLTETGLELDRAWMVVDARGVFVTQREQPRLALVRPHIEPDELVLNAPGMQDLHIARGGVNKTISVKLWDDEVPAFDMGDEAALWFTDFLAMSAGASQASRAYRPHAYRLVRFDPAHRRASNPDWTGGVQAFNLFSDGYPLLVLSDASLAELNQRLLAAGHASVGIERFRPNIVLSGLHAHDEDRLGVMHVQASTEEVLLKPVKPSPRCPIPNVDPQTATISPEVGDTLQSYRQDARVEGAVTFGMNTIVLQGVGATLQVGQTVTADFDFG